MGTNVSRSVGTWRTSTSADVLLAGKPVIRIAGFHHGVRRIHVREDLEPGLNELPIHNPVP
jgi:hypothetical protein